MDVADLIGRLASEGALMASAIDGADWDAPVPGTAWDLRELVIHTGAVHRWADDAIVRELASETTSSSVFRPVGSDDMLHFWFCTGLDALVRTLRDAPDDVPVFTFLRSPTPRHFWARRQAHETAIHRADAQAAVGPVTAFDPEFAQDGIAELVAGFACRRAFATDTAGTLALHCTDGPSWLVRFGGERNLVTETDDLSGASATVSGAASALYLWVWNRPAPVRVAGDPATLEIWQRIRI